MKWKRYLAVIGIIIFIYILAKIDISQVIIELTNTNFFWLFIAVIIVVVSFFTQTLKWYYIAKKQKIKLNFWGAFKINLINAFYGNITPSKIGSVIRADYLKKCPSGNIGKGLSNFILDKALDLTSLFITALVFSFVFVSKLGYITIVYMVLIFIFLLFGLWIIINKHRSEVILRFFFSKIVPRKIKEKARVTFDSFYQDLPSKRDLFFAFLLNLVNWEIIYLSTYVFGLALGINLPLFYFLAILPLGTVMGQIPISINGLGTRESVLISLFGLFGISATKVFSMSILGLFFSMILPAIPALFLIWKDRENKKNNKDYKL